MEVIQSWREAPVAPGGRTRLTDMSGRSSRAANLGRHVASRTTYWISLAALPNNSVTIWFHLSSRIYHRRWRHRDASSHIQISISRRTRTLRLCFHFSVSQFRAPVYSFCSQPTPPPPQQPPTLRRLRGRGGGGDVRLSTLDKWFCFDSSTLYSNVSALVDSEFIYNTRDYVTILFMCLSPGSIVLRAIHYRYTLQSIDVEALWRMHSKRVKQVLKRFRTPPDCQSIYSEI